MYLYRISFPLLLLCLSFSGLHGQVKILGKIHHPVDTVVTLLFPPTSLGGESRNVSTRLSAADEFGFAIRTKIATTAVITHGGFSIPIFIVPDQSFSLEFTADDREADEVLFAGAGGAGNTLLQEYSQFLEEEAPSIDSTRLARSTAREYRRLVDRNRAARELFLENYSSTAGIELPPQLLQWLRNDIAYTYATELLRYPSVFQKLHDGAKNRHPSTSYYSFLEGIRLNNPGAILQDSYQLFLESFIIYKLEKPMDWELRTGGERQYAFLSRFLFGPPLYYMQYLVFERTLNWLIEPDYMAQEYQAFMASKAPALLKQKLKKFWRSLTVFGKPTSSDSLSHSIQQLYPFNKISRTPSYFRTLHNPFAFGAWLSFLSPFPKPILWVVFIVGAAFDGLLENALHGLVNLR